MNFVGWIRRREMVIAWLRYDGEAPGGVILLTALPVKQPQTPCMGAADVSATPALQPQEGGNLIQEDFHDGGL